MKPSYKTPFSCDLLYITFIDLNLSSGTGSTVRPQKMLHAFEEMGLNVKVLSGEKTKRRKRREKIDEILVWLKENQPRACYIEPPSGPFYDWKDLYVLKRLRDKKVPIGLFYRDAYWMFPEYGADGNKIGMREKVKLMIIKGMHKRDLRVFKLTCSHIFFPSNSMAAYFDFRSQSALPPGCVIRKEMDDTNKELAQKEVLTFIFVGGAAKNHGTFLTLKAFEKANQNGIIAKLLYVCPKEQWKKVKDKVYIEEYAKWLSIYHVSGGEALEPLYGEADIALLTAPNTKYRSFAVPIKIYEYISHAKPVLVTNSYETEKVILENQVGWSVPDDILSVCSKIIYLHEHQTEIYEKKKNCKEACLRNSWKSRAQEVWRLLSSESNGSLLWRK